MLTHRFEECNLMRKVFCSKSYSIVMFLGLMFSSRKVSGFWGLFYKTYTKITKVSHKKSGMLNFLLFSPEKLLFFFGFFLDLRDIQWMVTRDTLSPGTLQPTDTMPIPTS